MIDLAEAPVLYIHRDANGAYDATLRAVAIGREMLSARRKKT